MGRSRKKKACASPTSEAPPPSRTKDEEKDDLVKEFGELIEESLIILFLEEQGFEQARVALAEIATTTRIEEASGFDPSGLQGGIVAASTTDDHSDDSSALHTPGGSSSSMRASMTSGYESAPGALSCSPLSDGGAKDDRCGAASGLPADADADSLASGLQCVFPDLKTSDIRRALRESGNDVDRASEILLNLQHLEQTGQRPKGIDAFFLPEHHQAARRAKKKPKNKTPLSPRGTRAIPLPLEYRLAPLVLDDAGPTGGTDAAGLSTLASLSSPSSPSSLAARLEEARVARAACSESFASATAAARRGRSDPLFRQAAVVYAERGHDLVQQARAAESDVADAMVDQQSAPGTVDVHFVPVHDGVRIAQERTRAWWERLGEDRVRKARDQPLRVITGIGLHSPRGYSRMYGEVGSALGRDGWRVQPGQGYYDVRGRKT